MIADRIERAERLADAVPGLKEAFSFLRAPGASSLPDGRHDIDGERVFALVQRYSTERAASPRFEAHRKYIDVQYVASGSETIGWAPLESLSVTEPYSGEKDVCFGSVPAWSPVLLRAGETAVFFPGDAHAPRLAAGEPGEVMKIVIKVAVT